LDPLYNGEPGQVSYLLEADPPVTVTQALLTLYDSADAVVGAVSGATGSYTPTTEAAEILLSYSWATPVTGQYRAKWKVTFSGGAIQTFEHPLLVVAAPPASKVATYDLATAIGLARFWANDRDVSDPLWSDEEVTAALTLTDSDPLDAALILLGQKALQYAEEAVIVQTNRRRIDLTKRAEALEKRIAMLKEMPTTLPVVDSPDRIFVPAYEDLDPATTMDPW
jgi:hypothetical protein